ncbi:unnamed protein product [Arabidopsis halleri]
MHLRTHVCCPNSNKICIILDMKLKNLWTVFWFFLEGFPVVSAQECGKNRFLYTPWVEGGVNWIGEHATTLLR